ncbi:hypothetical protein DSL92_01460 [Billgrantia gudaonensis]|uniref:Uncharacterized protein n=1 Tax=Billgrantia gudaonensis TaxID=376427 RepID=A0A3S0QS80_9GAMM|nr:hypothetical protein DSL92_01460 [Halomonas gudaonensis]
MTTSGRRGRDAGAGPDDPVTLRRADETRSPACSAWPPTAAAQEPAGATSRLTERHKGLRDADATTDAGASRQSPPQPTPELAACSTPTSLHARPAKQLVPVARRAGHCPLRVRLAEAGGNDLDHQPHQVSLGARRGRQLAFSAEGRGRQAALVPRCAGMSRRIGEAVLPFDESREHVALRGRHTAEPLPADEPHRRGRLAGLIHRPGSFVLQTPRFDYMRACRRPHVSQTQRLETAIP